MRFRARVEVWFDVATLDQGQAVANKIEAAVFDAVGPTLVPDLERALTRTVLEPMDEDARVALAADDLGPGISMARFEYGPPDPESS
jgi:hypothetical protein